MLLLKKHPYKDAYRILMDPPKGEVKRGSMKSSKKYTITLFFIHKKYPVSLIETANTRKRRGQETTSISQVEIDIVSRIDVSPPRCLLSQVPNIFVSEDIPNHFSGCGINDICLTNQITLSSGIFYGRNFFECISCEYKYYFHWYIIYINVDTIPTIFFIERKRNRISLKIFFLWSLSNDLD